MYGKAMVLVMNRPPQLALWQKSSLPPFQLYDTKPRGSYMTVQSWRISKQFLNLLLNCIYFFFKSIKQIVWSSVFCCEQTPWGHPELCRCPGAIAGLPMPQAGAALGTRAVPSPGLLPLGTLRASSAAWTHGSIPPQACTHGTAQACPWSSCTWVNWGSSEQHQNIMGVYNLLLSS